MPAHQFALGQAVRMKRSLGFSPTLPGSFRITGMLPERNNSPQYRMRSDSEQHDRVVTEADLEATDTAKASAGAAVWR